MCRSALAVIGAIVALAIPNGGFLPARYIAGAGPQLPARAVGGGQVFLELSIDQAGTVSSIHPLRTTSPFTDDAISAARGWVFRPAENDVLQKLAGGGQRMVRIVSDTKVLFAAVYRAPVLEGFTLGEQPRDVASPSPEIAFPIITKTPPYPPLARALGVVLLEARIGPEGAMSGIAVLQSAPPFDDVARATLRQWTFRPARRDGSNVAATVYVAFGFPAPVT